MIKQWLWKIFYSRWGKTPSKKVSGYSLLLMVPGDLPVFLQIAMEQCASQNFKNLVETVVVPDNVPPGFMPLYRKLQQGWTHGPIRLSRLNASELFLTKRLNNPHTNCWLQFVHGCSGVSSTHLLWHDADLFIMNKGFLEKHYEECLRQKCVLLGVNEAWDAWYRENGFAYLTSTWEILLDMDWVRSFAPWQHRGHAGFAGGKPHVFDITFLPQCLTSAELIRRHEGDWGFVHFNYIIGTYRCFQNSRGPFEDTGFKLLFVRLLVDAYQSDWHYEVPPFDELLRGIVDASCRVTYVTKETHESYGEFRHKLQKLMDSGVTGPGREAILRERVGRLDRVLNWNIR